MTGVVAVAVLAATAGPPRGMRIERVAMTPNSRLVLALGKSQLPLVADLYWIRSIALTTELRTPNQGMVLIRWCRFVSELDPQFIWPYLVGGLLGVMSTDAKTHYNVNEANELLAAGLERLPDEPRLAIFLSYNQLELQHDPKAAAQTLRRGSMSPRAPPFMAQLATRLMAQSGDFDGAREFALQLANSQDDLSRAFFQRRLQEIERDEVFAKAQAAVDAYRAARGRAPESLLQLSLEGFLPEIPIDPLGGTLSIDPITGIVSSTSGSRLKANISKQ